MGEFARFAIDESVEDDDLDREAELEMLRGAYLAAATHIDQNNQRLAAFDASDSPRADIVDPREGAILHRPFPHLAAASSIRTRHLPFLSTNMPEHDLLRPMLGACHANLAELRRLIQRASSPMARSQLTEDLQDSIKAVDRVFGLHRARQAAVMCGAGRGGLIPVGDAVADLHLLGACDQAVAALDKMDKRVFQHAPELVISWSRQAHALILAIGIGLLVLGALGVGVALGGLPLLALTVGCFAVAGGVGCAPVIILLNAIRQVGLPRLVRRRSAVEQEFARLEQRLLDRIHLSELDPRHVAAFIVNGPREPVQRFLDRVVLRDDVVDERQAATLEWVMGALPVEPPAQGTLRERLAAAIEASRARTCALEQAAPVSIPSGKADAPQTDDLPRRHTDPPPPKLGNNVGRLHATTF